MEVFRFSRSSASVKSFSPVSGSGGAELELESACAPAAGGGGFVATTSAMDCAAPGTMALHGVSDTDRNPLKEPHQYAYYDRAPCARSVGARAASPRRARAASPMRALACRAARHGKSNASRGISLECSCARRRLWPGSKNTHTSRRRRRRRCYLLATRVG